MCTAMTVESPCGDIFFGRTMDFSYELDPEVFTVPKGYRWNNVLNTNQIKTVYSFMGVGQNISPIVFTDGVNEMGFAAAALYFPGYAKYEPIQSSDTKTPVIAATELVKYLLSTCASVKQAVSSVSKLQIVGVEDAVTNSVAPLHWMIADTSGACMVIEKMEDGMHITENRIGVLLNSPDFEWHMTNLRNYLNVKPHQQQNEDWGITKLTPFGQGAGTLGLPGDYTPPSRFVRTAFLKTHTVFPKERKGSASACFHVMESVSIPRGVVMTAHGGDDYTQYTAFINLTTKEYLYKTYENSTIVTIPFEAENQQELTSLGKLNVSVN